jgi:Metalloenzyme superfamily
MHHCDGPHVAELAANVSLQIRSDTGIAFNKKPEMKAKEIAETGVEALKSGQYHQVWLLEQHLFPGSSPGCVWHVCSLHSGPAAG